VIVPGNFGLLLGSTEGLNLKVQVGCTGRMNCSQNCDSRYKTSLTHATLPVTVIMLKITDITGTINEIIPSEIAKCVGIWADMVNSEHSRDDDVAVCPILLLC
jgi:hypothetical protein